KPVTYDWLFLCELGFIAGLGASGARLGVLVFLDKIPEPFYFPILDLLRKNGNTKTGATLNCLT
ncbi:MAG: hypothetical protein ACYTEU_08825, partial [Planctomycetota bacterium]